MGLSGKDLLNWEREGKPSVQLIRRANDSSL
jgi:hypothetical protein